MENKKNTIINGIEINKSKADMMLKKLIVKEKNNIRTKKYNDIEMINNIKKLIEEEVKCY